MNVWVMKQRGRRLGMTWDVREGDRLDWIDLATVNESGTNWRGPSYPREAVYEVPAGDLVVVWDTAEKIVWEANVSLGRVSFHTWTDVEADEEVPCFGLEMVRVAAYPCIPSDEDYEAIVGDRNAAGRPIHGRVTLHRLPRAIGFGLWKRIVNAAAEYHLSEEGTA